MHERSCPDCRTGWRDDAARWCGCCGAALPASSALRRLRPRRAWLAAPVAGTLIAGLAAIGSAGCCSTASLRPTDDRVAVAPVVMPSVSTGGLGASATGIGGGLLVIAQHGRLVAQDTVADRVLFVRDLAELGMADPATEVSIRPFDGGIVVARGGYVALLERDGSTRWQVPNGADTTRVVIADGERTVLLGTNADVGMRLQVVGVADGEVRFTRDIDGLVGVEEQTALVRDAGQRSGVTAISLADGSVRWAAPASSAGRDDG